MDLVRAVVRRGPALRPRMVTASRNHLARCISTYAGAYRTKPRVSTILGTAASLCVGAAASCVPIRAHSTSASTPNYAFDGYTFDANVHVIPHPEKAEKGGEDASFISKDGRVLAVADGVGGWNDVGIDPAEYSRAIIKGTEEFTRKPNYNRNPQEMMEAGYQFAKEAKAKGSSTLCVCVIDAGILKTANIGDCAFMVIRDKSVFYKSKEQTKAFNFPFQLGNSSPDTPKMAAKVEIKLMEHDIVIVGSDGLYDNLFDTTILKIALSTTSTKDIAAKLATEANRIGGSKERTPFEVGALRAGYPFQGGKLDDVTVIVARVKSNQAKL